MVKLENGANSNSNASYLAGQLKSAPFVNESEFRPNPFMFLSKLMATNRNGGPIISTESNYPTIAPLNDDYDKCDDNSDHSLTNCNDNQPSSEILKALLQN